MKQFISGFKSHSESLFVLLNSILLLFVYFIAIGPTSIISKLVKKNFFDRSKKETYWKDSDLKKKDTEEYYKQY